MGIAIPRPTMRMGGREDRMISARLKFHQERAAFHQSNGMSRDDASNAAYKETIALKFSATGEIKAPTKTASDSAGYRVVYGETMPAWEKIFPTKREAEAFAKKHRSFGDIIFSIARVIPGEHPQSMMAAIEAAEAAKRA